MCAEYTGTGPGNASVLLGMRPIAMLVLLCGCADVPATDPGVDVFSADTAAVRISVVASGSLAIGLRADRMYTTPERSIVLETPASLLFQRGEGTAFVSSLDTTQRIVVQPLGVPLDSAEQLGVTGTAIAVVRRAGHSRLTLTVQKP